MLSHTTQPIEMNDLSLSALDKGDCKNHEKKKEDINIIYEQPQRMNKRNMKRSFDENEKTSASSVLLYFFSLFLFLF